MGIKQVPVYIRISEDINSMAQIYINESKILGRIETNTKNKLVEKAIHEFIVRHPHTTRK